MKYRYHADGYGSYGGYGRRKKKINGGTVALIIAMIIVFVAGMLIGNTRGNLLNGNTSSDPTGSAPSSNAEPSSSENKPSSSEPEKEPDRVTLPGGLTYVPVPGNTTTVGDLNTVTAGSYIVIDRMTGAIVLEKNSGSKIFPGAATHIMTAGLALEKASCGDTLKATSFAVSLLGSGSIKLGLTKNETIRMEDALAAMLLSSCADAANVIADSQGYNSFVRIMRTRSAELGCSGSYFINPTGVSSNSHFSTAADVARMEAFAQQHGDYRRITLAESAALAANNVHKINGWKVVQDNDLTSGVKTLFRNSATISAVDNTVAGIDKNGYTLVCSFTTAKGARLTAVMAGLPYNGGKGADACVAQMAALMNAAAKTADAASGTTVVPVNEALSADLTAGVAGVLPEGRKLVASQGFRLVQGEKALQNGSDPLFGTKYTVTATYYDGLQQVLDNFNGNTAEVGYLTVCNGEGNPAVEKIPLLLK